MAHARTGLRRLRERNGRAHLFADGLGDIANARLVAFNNATEQR